MLIIVSVHMQVSSVTEHGGAQDTGAKSADFDDDDGGGLVRHLTITFLVFHLFTHDFGLL